MAEKEIGTELTIVYKDYNLDEQTAIQFSQSDDMDIFTFQEQCRKFATVIGYGSKFIEELFPTRTP